MKKRTVWIVALGLCATLMVGALAGKAPEGWIAFHPTRGGNREIYVMREDGSDLRRITDHPGNDRLAA